MLWKKKKKREGIIFNFSVTNIKRGHKCNRNSHPNAKKENFNVANDACMNVLCGSLWSAVSENNQRRVKRSALPIRTVSNDLMIIWHQIIVLYQHSATKARQITLDVLETEHQRAALPSSIITRLTVRVRWYTHLNDWESSRVFGVVLFHRLLRSGPNLYLSFRTLSFSRVVAVILSIRCLPHRTNWHWPKQFLNQINMGHYHSATAISLATQLVHCITSKSLIRTLITWQNKETELKLVKLTHLEFPRPAAANNAPTDLRQPISKCMSIMNTTSCVDPYLSARKTSNRNNHFLLKFVIFSPEINEQINRRNEKRRENRFNALLES